MASRRIQSPGIEINEIDRSQYNKVDYSLPNSPTLLVTGFANKGEDYALQWINSKTTLDDTYGTPVNEIERYFYNAICEILNRGGTCVAAKLPYINDSYNNYNYIEYETHLCNILDLKSQLAIQNFSTIEEFHDTLSITIDYLQNQGKQVNVDSIDSITKMAKSLSSIVEQFGDSQTQSIMPSQHENVTVRSMFEALSSFMSNYTDLNGIATLQCNDPSLTSYIDIKCKPLPSMQNAYGGMDSLENLDGYLTNNKKPKENTIRIYDMTHAQYSKLDSSICSYVSTSIDNRSNDFLGIVPIITTPTNALFFQNMLDFTVSHADKIMFSQVSCFTSLYSKENNNAGLSSISSDLVLQMASSRDNDSIDANVNVHDYNEVLRWTSSESLSRKASLLFPSIDYSSTGNFKKDHLKKIGIAVFKAFKDLDNNSKVNFELVESFIGSLDPTSKDPLTKANLFIDDVVNASSQYIKVFSNVNSRDLLQASTISMSGQPAISMGFYKTSCSKRIEYVKSIQQALSRILESATNKYTLPLDLVVDAGVSNIAQIVKSNNSSIDLDEKPNIADFDKFKLDKTGGNDQTSGWKSVLKKFDDFVKYTRKDCMFIADGLRPFCLDGNVKIVRKTAPANTVANAIMPKLKYMSNVFDSSYTAGYCNWFYQQDYSSTDYMWMPPSIKAAGVFIYCDTYFQPWSAPAGLTRGVLTDAVDVAFVPNEDDAGKIYNAQWNYAMSYPLDGIVVEGHKTFQTQKTALDRINVRRLLLYLEKRTVQIARKFVYEGNTSYLRQQFVDTLRPIYEDAVRRDGLAEYAIKCDDEINTTEVIENNEMRCRIAVKPVKVVDFIVIDLIATRQSADVTEEVLS